ncbi:MAG: ferredoxin [Candidatus Margulisiibacteriota bacterium]
MANAKDRYWDGEAGPFFVDKDCIACDTCAGVAPKHFKLTDDSDHALVFAQPVSDAEEAVCLEALEACPVDAIGRLA